MHMQRSYRNVKWDFIMELVGTFDAFIRSNGRTKGYPEHVLTIFIRFNCMTEHYLNFELDRRDFRRFGMLQLGEEEWMSVYRLMNEVTGFRHYLNPFIYLFFYNMIYYGPFGDDIEKLEMSDELLGFMDRDMLKLYRLSGEYFNSNDSSLVKDIADVSKEDTIPAFFVINIANRINECTGDDKGELGDLICQLYAIALDKIYKKPQLKEEDRLEISSIFSKVDNSGFSDIQIDIVYSAAAKYNMDKKSKSINIDRRILNPRYRC